jgi:hypothetical protein
MDTSPPRQAQSVRVGWKRCAGAFGAHRCPAAPNQKRYLPFDTVSKPTRFALEKRLFSETGTQQITQPLGGYIDRRHRHALGLNACVLYQLVQRSLAVLLIPSGRSYPAGLGEDECSDRQHSGERQWLALKRELRQTAAALRQLAQEVFCCASNIGGERLRCATHQRNQTLFVQTPAV